MKTPPPLTSSVRKIPYMKAWGKCLGRLEVLTVVILKCQASRKLRLVNWCVNGEFNGLKS